MYHGFQPILQQIGNIISNNKCNYKTNKRNNAISTFVENTIIIKMETGFRQEANTLLVYIILPLAS